MDCGGEVIHSFALSLRDRTGSGIPVHRMVSVLLSEGQQASTARRKIFGVIPARTMSSSARN
jgi:hypothetical protein